MTSAMPTLDEASADHSRFMKCFREHTDESGSGSSASDSSLSVKLEMPADARAETCRHRRRHAIAPVAAGGKRADPARCRVCAAGSWRAAATRG